MTPKATLYIPTLLALAAALAGSPVAAQQGHGRGHGKDEQRVERRDREDDDDRDDRDGRPDRKDNGNHRGWCQGVGNPHNTVQNCGYNNSRSSRADRYDRNGNSNGGYYDRNGVWHSTSSRNDGYYDRNGVWHGTSTSGRYGTSGGYGSNGSYGTYGSRAQYDQAHQAFHQQQDRQCRAQENQRPLDLQWRLQVRNQCRAEHEAWHQRYDPNRR